MRRGVSNKLSKDQLLSKVSQEMIMAKYLNISLDTVLKCIANNELILSPFREDHTPTFGIQFNNKNKLKACDFNGTFFGDVFDVVAYVLSFVQGRVIDINKKDEFYMVLKHIAHTFRHYISGDVEDLVNTDLIRETVNTIRRRKPVIKVIPRAINRDDVELWNKWGITPSYLQTHFTIPVDMYYIDEAIYPAPKYLYHKDDPCYAYVLGNVNGVYNIKLYFPKRSHNMIKFITNSNTLEGIIHLDRSDYDIILITKSSKDRLAIGCHLERYPLRGEFRDLVIGVINLPSESYKLKQNEYSYLAEKLTTDGIILSLCDFDRTGRICARYMKDVFNIPYLFITRGELGLNDYSAKDFSELKELYSDEVINEFINETLNVIYHV